MGVYNSMPDNAVLMTDYLEFKDFFTYCLSEEMRQPFYTNDVRDGGFNIRIYWVDKKRRLGFGIADNWKEKKIDWYKFGTDEEWLIWKRGFAAQFSGDNS